MFDQARPAGQGWQCVGRMLQCVSWGLGECMDPFTFTSSTNPMWELVAHAFLTPPPPPPPPPQHNWTSLSNGALMRASPLAAWAAGLPEEQIVAVARADASLTHPNPTAQVGASAGAPGGELQGRAPDSQTLPPQPRPAAGCWEAPCPCEARARAFVAGACTTDDLSLHECAFADGIYLLLQDANAAYVLALVHLVSNDGDAAGAAAAAERWAARAAAPEVLEWLQLAKRPGPGPPVHEQAGFLRHAFVHTFRWGVAPAGALRRRCSRVQLGYGVGRRPVRAWGAPVLLQDCVVVLEATCQSGAGWPLR